MQIFDHFFAKNFHTLYYIGGLDGSQPWRMFKIGSPARRTCSQSEQPRRTCSQSEQPRAAGGGRRLLLTNRNCGRSGQSLPDFCKNVNRLKT